MFAEGTPKVTPHQPLRTTRARCKNRQSLARKIMLDQKSKAAAAIRFRAGAGCKNTKVLKTKV